MKKLKCHLLAMACALIASASASAGFNESDWDFKKDEDIIVYFNNEQMKMGTVYVCEKFTPSTVSFTIEYEEPADLKFKLMVNADGDEKVTHDKNNRRYTVNKASRLEVGFPYGGKYRVKNISGEDVQGSVCDTGDYG